MGPGGVALGDDRAILRRANAKSSTLLMQHGADDEAEIRGFVRLALANVTPPWCGHAE